MEKPIFWRQGLFLQPQHLQLNDLYNQSQLTPYNKYIMPHLWGVGKLKIVESSLPNFTFNIDDAVLWFSDMTLASLSDNAVLESRAFDESWVDGGNPLIVYVGLKKNNRFKRNVTVVQDLENLADINTRFVTTVNPEEIIDLHHDGPPANVQNLNLLLKIFFHPEIERLGAYELIPVAQLERSGEKIIMSPNFIPPCFAIDGSKNLYDLIIEISDRLMARSRELESYKKQKNVHTAQFGPRDMVYLLSLRSLTRYVHLLNHFIEANSHPWSIYGVLRQLAGELSCFSERINFFATGDNENLIKKYDHNKLWECFSKAGSIVSGLLNEITAGPQYVISMENDGTCYCSELKPDHFEAGARFYLVIETDADPQSLSESIDEDLKIGSRLKIEDLITHSLPGVKISYLSTPPQELPLRQGCIYYSLSQNEEPWDDIKKDKSIALHWDGAPEDFMPQLMIVRRK